MTSKIYQVVVDGQPIMFGAFDHFADLDLAMDKAKEFFVVGGHKSITINCDPSRDPYVAPADLLADEVA